MTASMFTDYPISSFLARAVKTLLCAAYVILATQVYMASDVPPDASIDDSATVGVVQVIVDQLKMGGHGPEMVVVPVAGEKVRNCIPEKVCDETITDIVRSMINSPYAISRYEITFDDFDRFCEATGRTKPEDYGWGRGSRPVIFVSWKDALGYAKWLTDRTGFAYRLPSVIEWEHAARAGRHTAYWWGAELGENRANCRDCGSKWSQLQTAPVGSFPPNPWGIYDMHGNVSEFTQDCALTKRRRFSPFKGRSMYKLSAESRFVEDCAMVHVKGASWQVNHHLAFRRKTDQNNKHFPERFTYTSIRTMSVGMGIRVVRDM